VQKPFRKMERGEKRERKRVRESERDR